MTKIRLAIGSDHGGLNLKSTLKNYISETRENIEVSDFGTHNSDSVDYPDFGQAVAKAVQENEVDLGILVCGTGIGMSIAANRHSHIRAALCSDEDMARLSRQHNNANVLVIGGRTTSLNLAKKIIDVFVSTEFEKGRHTKRLKKIS